MFKYTQWVMVKITTYAPTIEDADAKVKEKLKQVAGYEDMFIDSLEETDDTNEDY